MREIKFRGKTGTTEGQKWVYGYYHKVVSFFSDNQAGYIDTIKNDHLIENQIDINTIGQYTGLKDKNGKEIYEGDIVIMHYFFENYGADLGVFEDEAEIIGIVCINEYHTFVKAKNGDVYSLCDYIQEPSEELEVIGNIYDNPELLEVKDEL